MQWTDKCLIAVVAQSDLHRKHDGSYPPLIQDSQKGVDIHCPGLTRSMAPPSLSSYFTPSRASSVQDGIGFGGMVRPIDKDPSGRNMGRCTWWRRPQCSPFESSGKDSFVGHCEANGRRMECYIQYFGIFSLSIHEKRVRSTTFAP